MSIEFVGMDEKLEINAQRHYSGAINIYMGYKISHEKIMMAQPVTVKETENGYVHDPLITLHHHHAQTLMDQLWVCGIRPTEGTGSAGALAATERHLKDLQRIVFKEK